MKSALHLALAATMSLAPLSAATAQDPGGFHLDLGLGMAEHGDGLRPSYAVGYGFENGFGLLLSTQKLQEIEVVSTFFDPQSNAIVSVSREFPELSSTALLVSYRWNLDGAGRWLVQAHGGVHRWRYSTPITGAESPHTVRDSGHDPVIRLDASVRAAERFRVGVALERYWLGSEANHRGSVFARYTFR